jgi:hypothetical protein
MMPAEINYRLQGVLPLLVVLCVLIASACARQPEAPFSLQELEGAAAPEVLLRWKGKASTAEAGQKVCGMLQILSDGQAQVARCGDVAETKPLFAMHYEEWAGIQQHFAPAARETPSETLILQASGDLSGPLWESALSTWARLTYEELTAPRVGAATRTALSWHLGEIPEKSGTCRHLTVLVYGYAYVEQVPCAGGQSELLSRGWLATGEMEALAGWLSSRPALYHANNYLAGQGPGPSHRMSPADAEAIGAWSQGVYDRLAGS